MEKAFACDGGKQDGNAAKLTGKKEYESGADYRIAGQRGRETTGNLTKEMEYTVSFNAKNGAWLFERTFWSVMGGK